MYRLFVLGAGFSKPAGLPLGNELLEDVLVEAKRTTHFENILRREIERYLLFIERTTGEPRALEDIGLEPFMSFLDTEHALGFEGGDTFSDEGGRAQLLVRFLIARVLWRRQLRMPPSATALYDEFASRLEANDWILTFNYDTIVEDALTRVRKPFRLVPARYKNVDRFYAEYADEPDHDVVLLKLHGSIDWFQRDHFIRNSRNRKPFGFPDKARDAVFNNPRTRPRKLVRGPYWRGSPLRNVYRVLNMDAFFEQAVPLLDTPLLISPSFSKPLYLRPLHDLWRDMSSIGSFNSTLAIVGYSLPPYDDYVLQALYAAVRNFQHVDATGIVEKTSIKIVDYRTTDASQQQYRNAYRFVDWARADVDWNGFSERSLDMIFGG
ncbi:MAG: SIR2 family protein [Acidobacteriota bacterium]|nr:SIR2 family protein [Acidobacteriota bacterium]